MKTRILMGLALAAAVAACSDGTGPAGSRQVSLSFTTNTGASPLFSRMGVADDTLTSGTDELVISRVQVVLRQIELKRQNDDVCDSIPGTEDCEEFETGPVLVDLPLGGLVATMVTVPVDTGTYDEIQFEVHKAEGSDDATLIGENPDFAGISIRVEGTWNGTAFVYTSDLDVEQEIELTSPLVISDASAPTNLTLQVDVGTWFRNASGALVDPASGNKNGANEGLVKENIKISFKGFEDRNRDGDESNN